MSKPLARLLDGLRHWNRRRLERRRWRSQLLEALADDDAAIMEALARLVEESRAEGAARAAALEELTRQIAAVTEPQAGQAAAGEKPSRQPWAPAAASVPFPYLTTGKAALLEPELALLRHLAPSLSPRLALDVGAHHGLYSRALLDLGFEVHALEPNPATRAELVRQLEGRPGLTIHACAAGAEDGEATLGLVADPGGQYRDVTTLASLAGLPLAEGLVPAGSVTVPVRRLDRLLRERGLPVPALIKVDAEGWDLEVLRGLGDLWPRVLLAEFWDEALPFSAPGARNRLPDLVAHARAHGAAHHLVVFRRWGDGRAAFYSSWTESPERTYGNVLFFTEEALFEAARRHLATLVPEARFVAAPGP